MLPLKCSPTLYISSILLLLLIASTQHHVAADCMCVAAGDPHYHMCDAKTSYDWQGTGLHQMFKTKSVEVQCINVGNGVVSTIDHCRVRISSGGCDLVMQTPGLSAPALIVNGDTVTKNSAALDPRFKTKLLFKKNNALQINIEADGGHIALGFSRMSFRVTATNITRCSGMCGTCDGPQQRPTNVKQFVEPFVHVDAITDGRICGQGNDTIKVPPASSKGGKATQGSTTTNSDDDDQSTPSNDNSTTTPTTTGSNSKATTTGSNSNSTTTPTTKPILGRAPRYMAPNESTVPGHPVFESETVMREVHRQCLAGQPDSRITEDVIFGSFVENCIYDKSLGPGAEQSAQAVMETYVEAVDMARQLERPEFANNNATRAPLNLAAILTPTVTKRPFEIPVGEGATYVLRLTPPIPSTVPKADYLAMRTVRFSPVAKPSSPFQFGGIGGSDAISSMTRVETGNTPSTSSDQSITQKLRLHFDIEAPMIVIQPPAPAVKSETKTVVVQAPPPPQPIQQSRRRRIPIDNDEDDDQAPAPSTKVAPATPKPTTPAPTTVAPTTTPPTTAPPTTAPPTSAPIKQYQIATIIRQREVPADQVKVATPAPTLPFSIVQGGAQPGVQTITTTPAPAAPAMSYAPMKMVPMAQPVQPMPAPMMGYAPMRMVPVQPTPARPMPIQAARRVQLSPAQEIKKGALVMAQPVSPAIPMSIPTMMTQGGGMQGQGGAQLAGQGGAQMVGQGGAQLAGQGGAQMVGGQAAGAQMGGGQAAGAQMGGGQAAGVQMGGGQAAGAQMGGQAGGAQMGGQAGGAQMGGQAGGAQMGGAQMGGQAGAQTGGQAAGAHLSGQAGAQSAGQAGAQLAGQAGAQSAGHAGAQLAGHSGAQSAGHSGAQYAGHSGAQYAGHSGAQYAGHSGAQYAGRAGAHMGGYGGQMYGQGGDGRRSRTVFSFNGNSAAPTSSQWASSAASSSSAASGGSASAAGAESASAAGGGSSSAAHSGSIPSVGTVGGEEQSTTIPAVGAGASKAVTPSRVPPPAAY